ncbi:hypothetical protein IAD21_00705 [Abditibacteriota bacterium]|nr:hypothetical protein IAD21_00705 [Abditibacteriota bacterium]
MSAPIKVPFTNHFDFHTLPQIRVMESFAQSGWVYAGVQNGIWPYDEYYWSERKGTWGGVLPMPARETVGHLRLSGATREEFGPLHEPLDRIASGVPLIALGEILYRYDFYALGVPSGASEHRLYNCATGALVASAGLGGALGTVPDGSYMLWARTFAGEPFQTGHGLARIKDGEWSALRVVVGSGTWSVAPNVCPGPGAALYRKDQSAAETVITSESDESFRVAFDPLARCVSASCVLEAPILTKTGVELIPAGTRLIGGLRSSASGPQTALWVLHPDGTTKIIALQVDFTDGACECAKTNHFASDIVQGPNGDLFVLTECALFRFDPDASSVYEALQGYPAKSVTPGFLLQSQGSSPEAGYPGGNCLRFPQGEMIHWAENFGGVNDGTPHYNRMVRRVAGRDVSGPSTLWHGPNCAETYLGRFWGIRADDDETLYLDWLDNGRWHGYSGMNRPINATFWQRLRAVGNTLFLFGFKPGAPLNQGSKDHTNGQHDIDPKTGKPVSTDPQGQQDGAQSNADTPLCAVADGLTLRDAAFPYFVRRATVANESRVFVTARAGDTGIGPANRVVEIIADNGGRTHLCSFWNETDKAFELNRADFESLGGDTTKLPPCFVWQPLGGVDAGGKWKARDSSPIIGFWLETLATSSTLKFSAHPSGTIPYDVSVWNRLCFDILSDSSLDTEDGPIIEPTCHNARCVLDSLPEGTRFRVVQRPVHDAANPITAIQITDASDQKRLSTARNVAPTLWMRIDSPAPQSDLTTYTHMVNYSRLIPLSQTAKSRVEVVVLVPPTNQPLKAHELPIVSRRA